MRGMKSIKTAKLLMDGWLVHYNFFREHESLGDRTPAEKAGIKFPYRNWLDVVKRQATPKQEDEEDSNKLKLTRASPATIKLKHACKAKSQRLKKKNWRVLVLWELEYKKGEEFNRMLGGGVVIKVAR